MTKTPTIKYYLFPLLLMVMQGVSFLIFNVRFSPEPGSYDGAIVLANYIALFVAVIFSALTTHIVLDSKASNKESKIYSAIKLLIISAGFVLSIKATYSLSVYIAINGFEGLRTAFYTNPEIINDVFGGFLLYFAFSTIIKPFILFIIIEEMVKSKKNMFILIISILTYLSSSIFTGGRFGVYQIALALLIILYVKKTSSGKLKKNLVLISSLVFLLALSHLMQINRDATTLQFSVNESIMSVVDYHILPPFLLADKVASGFNGLSGCSIPGEATFGTLLMPIQYLFGLKPNEICMYSFGEYLNSATLTNLKTGDSYNAFGTLFAYIIYDFGMLSPVFTFVFGFILVKVCMVVPIKYREAYLVYSSLSLYFSLFSSLVTSFAFQAIILLLISGFFIRRTFRSLQYVQT